MMGENVDNTKNGVKVFHIVNVENPIKLSYTQSYPHYPPK